MAYLVYRGNKKPDEISPISYFSTHLKIMHIIHFVYPFNAIQLHIEMYCKCEIFSTVINNNSQPVFKI